MKWEGTLVAVLLLAGCAAARPAQHETPATPAHEEMGRAVDELETHKRALGLPRAAGDCAAVCRLAEAICRASERICVIAGRHPEEATFEERCRGAREDCSLARADCESCR